MKTKLDVIKEDLESVETALEKKNKTLQILKVQQEEERSLVSLTSSSPQTALTWIFIGILFLFLCYGLMKICHKYKGVVSNIRLLLGKDPSLIHRTRSSKVSFTKDNEELKFFNTSEGSLTQATSPEVLLMTEQFQNQRLSENTDSPSAISKQLMYGSKRSLTSEHSYYGKP